MRSVGILLCCRLGRAGDGGGPAWIFSPQEWCVGPRGLLLPTLKERHARLAWHPPLHAQPASSASPGGGAYKNSCQPPPPRPGADLHTPDLSQEHLTATPWLTVSLVPCGQSQHALQGCESEPVTRVGKGQSLPESFLPWYRHSLMYCGKVAFWEMPGSGELEQFLGDSTSYK